MIAGMMFKILRRPAYMPKAHDTAAVEVFATMNRGRLKCMDCLDDTEETVG